MSQRACHWCENDGHIKARCPDYQNCLAQQIVHGMVLFLEGLPVNIAKKGYQQVKLDTKKLETFERQGCFYEAVEATLTHNHADADFDRLRLQGNKERGFRTDFPLSFYLPSRSLHWSPHGIFTVG